MVDNRREYEKCDGCKHDDQNDSMGCGLRRFDDDTYCDIANNFKHFEPIEPKKQTTCKDCEYFMGEREACSYDGLTYMAYSIKHKCRVFKLKGSIKSKPDGTTCKTCKYSTFMYYDMYICKKNDTEKCRYDETWRSWVSVDEPEQPKEVEAKCKAHEKCQTCKNLDENKYLSKYNTFGCNKQFLNKEKKHKLFCIPSGHDPIGFEPKEPSKLRKDTICVDCEHFHDIGQQTYGLNHKVCSQGYYIDVDDDNTSYNHCNYSKKEQPVIKSKQQELVDEQIKLENKILQTQFDAQRIFTAKRSSPFIHWDLDKEVKQKTKQKEQVEMMINCDICNKRVEYGQCYGNTCEDCYDFELKQKEEKTMEKPKSLKEVERRIAEKVDKRRKIIEAIHKYRSNKDVYRKSKFFKDKILTKQFRKTLKLSSYEAFFFRIFYDYKEKEEETENILHISGKKWSKIFKKFEGYEDVIEGLKTKTDEYLLKEKMDLLCHIAPCYKDKKKTKRTKILLQTCEHCGVDTPIESRYCCDCGKEVKF